MKQLKVKLKPAQKQLIDRKIKEQKVLNEIRAAVDDYQKKYGRKFKI